MLSFVISVPNLRVTEEYTFVSPGIVSYAFVVIFLTFVPVIVSVARTSLEVDEIKWKLRDTMGGPRVDTGSYSGKLWETEQTVGKKLLGETEFARCDVHSVVSLDQKSIINDWIFLVRRVCGCARWDKNSQHAHNTDMYGILMTHVLYLGRTRPHQRGCVYKRG